MGERKSSQGVNPAQLQRFVVIGVNLAVVAADVGYVTGYRRGTVDSHAGRPAAATAAFLMSYVQPDKKNAAEGKGANPRDQSPHGVTLGSKVLPQSWTIVMTSDSGDYEITATTMNLKNRFKGLSTALGTFSEAVSELDKATKSNAPEVEDDTPFSKKLADLTQTLMSDSGEQKVVKLSEIGVSSKSDMIATLETGLVLLKDSDAAQKQAKVIDAAIAAGLKAANEGEKSEGADPVLAKQKRVAAKAIQKGSRLATSSFMKLVKLNTRYVKVALVASRKIKEQAKD